MRGPYNVMEVLFLLFWRNTCVVLQQIHESWVHQLRTDRLQEPWDVFRLVGIFYAIRGGPLSDWGFRHRGVESLFLRSSQIGICGKLKVVVVMSEIELLLVEI